MAQHFLLSAAARTLSLKAIYSEGEEAAYRRFCRLRWTETKGAPVCPICGCLDIYDLTPRRHFKCAACQHQFSATSGTIFASRKLSFVDLPVRERLGGAALAGSGCAAQDSVRAHAQASRGHDSGDEAFVRAGKSRPGNPWPSRRNLGCVVPRNLLPGRSSLQAQRL